MSVLELVLAHLNSNLEMCDECFLCCDYFPMPVWVCSLRAEERVEIRHFIRSEVQARNGVLAPGA